MARSTKSKKNILPIILLILIIILLVSGISLIILNITKNSNVPKLYMETNARLVAMSQEEFYIDINLSEFPEDSVYPASSFILAFDNDKLEFTGLRLGTMGVCDESGQNLNTPTWECNTELSNQKATISAMYMDMTANDSSYRSKGYEKGSKDTMARVQFILKDSAVKGDELKFSFQDAVLASIDNSSLSMVDETLDGKEFSIKVK